jgi:hypothetical protein
MGEKRKSLASRQHPRGVKALPLFQTIFSPLSRREHVVTQYICAQAAQAAAKISSDANPLCMKMKKFLL